MQRRNFIASLAALIPAPLLKQKKKWTVETLEHGYIGKGEKYQFSGVQYIPRWTFNSREEAHAFVRTIYPRLNRQRVYDDVSMRFIDQIRSGYRQAVRYQIKGIIDRQEWDLIRYLDDTYEKIEVLEIDRPPFHSVDEAWGYLLNMRVNGEIVQRPRGKSNSHISDYHVKPFNINRDGIERVKYFSSNRPIES